MRAILAGIETEYGLLIAGKGAESQVEEAQALVREATNEGLGLWDDRHESPRNDLRGFKLDRLAYDPVDAAFERRVSAPAAQIREDRILRNGARFYNDHGHPEYSTPECFSLRELALHDQAGERIVLSAAREHQRRTGIGVTVYKNNTDFHGASYGTHENYLVPRGLALEALTENVTPMLVLRSLLCGAGKVGAEAGQACDFQLSQRADFLVEPINTETLFRRPIFNTRDEPHADPARWMRLHVISGDANMNPRCTVRKMALVKLSVSLAESGWSPPWRLRDPVSAFHQISRGSLDLAIEGGNAISVQRALEDYFAAAEERLELEPELSGAIRECRDLLTRLGDHERIAGYVDWAAKRMLVQMHLDEGGTWQDPMLRSIDLEYSNLDPESGLYYGLVAAGMIEPWSTDADVELRRRRAPEPTRAFVRGLAVERFSANLVNACWRSLTFRLSDRTIEVELQPDRLYPAHLSEIDDVEDFVRALQEQA